MAQRIARVTHGAGKDVARVAALAALIMLAACSGERLPEGYMSQRDSQKILDKTLTVRLAPEMAHLTDAERQTVDILLEVGSIMQELYETQKHHQARSAYAALLALNEEKEGAQATQNLIDLYRLAEGPIVRNVDNELVAFLPVDARVPGRNVYPWGVTRQELDSFMGDDAARRRDVLDVRRVVRRTTPAAVEADLATLRTHDLIKMLHPDLEQRLESLLTDGADEFYTVPYSVAYADRLTRVHELLQQASDTIEPVDADFAGYLRQRALDLLRDNYEAGDAAWVTGRFGNINAQIGSYEVYDDELYGVKTFFSTSVLIKQRAMSSSVHTVLEWLQDLEDILPYDHHKKVRQDIPVDAYEVVADFGQARGTNTATILPNESYITRKYGRTILLRYNIMTHPGLFEERKSAFEAAVAEDHHADYDTKGDFFRTLFHEIGHYLGVDMTRDGRTLDIAFEEDSSILEELKADLVSLYVCKWLYKRRYYDTTRLRAVQASGIRRVLRKHKPSKSQVYATMELMQMNYYLEKGLLEYDAATNKLLIHTGEYHQAVEAMLREVLELQYNGDKAVADAFIAKYSTWDEDLHGRIARAMRDAETYRWALVRYAALGE